MMCKKYYSIAKLSQMQKNGELDLSYNKKVYKSITSQQKTKFIIRFLYDLNEDTDNDEYTVYANKQYTVIDGAIMLKILLDYLENKFILDLRNLPVLGHLERIVLDGKPFCKLSCDLQKWFKSIVVKVYVIDEDITLKEFVDEFNIDM